MVDANHRLRLGDSSPEFSLPGVDGRAYTLAQFSDKPVLIIVFSCNHCPYVQAYEGRVIAIQRDYGRQGVQVVSINSNDAVNYPEDGFDEMVSRSKEKNFNFPYLRDASQEIAKRYGASHTPQLFVFDQHRHLRYTGKIDDNWQHPEAVSRTYLRDAVDALLAHRDPEDPVTHAIGCTIKWSS